MKFGFSNEDSRESMPPYAYIPGGPWPHPSSSPMGHSHGKPHLEAPPITDDDWQASAFFLRGIALFNAGYYWEAHEYWEALWHAHGRQGPIALMLQGLIKLAAAGVKIRERQPQGVISHARRAAAHFVAVRESGFAHILGLELDECIARAQALAQAPPADRSERTDPVAQVIPFTLEPMPRSR